MQKAGRIVRFRPGAWSRAVGATLRRSESLRLRNTEKAQAWDSAQTGQGLGGGLQGPEPHEGREGAQ